MRVTLYRLPPRVSPGVAREFEIASRSHRGMTYRVCLMADGSWSCECPAWRYNSRGDGLCAHIDEAVAAVLFVPSLAEIL